jgi:hypothetical protein
MSDRQPLANPLMGSRQDREHELCDLVTAIATSEDLDPVQVIMELSEWNGHSYVNPAAMPDDRLLHTLLTARGRAKPAESSKPPLWQLKGIVRQRHSEWTKEQIDAEARLMMEAR